MSWAIFAAFGFLTLWIAWKSKNSKVDLVCIWVAVSLFLQAGFTLGSGWLGNTIQEAVVTTNSTGNEVLSNATGAKWMWVLAVVLSIALIMGLLPWFEASVPDWLAVTGLVLPSLLRSVPGPAGDFFLTLAHGPAGLVGGLLTTFFTGS